MARAFRTATPAALDREDFTTRNTYYHVASDRNYQMVRRGDRFYQRRWQTGYQGRETNVVEKEVHYVLGSGNHARTYLHRTADNRLIQLPLGWYAENGGAWAMNPGYDRPDHQDFRREAGYACLFCHNGYPKVADDRYDAPAVYPAEMPQGIDCQRCHGPGAAHASSMGKQPILRPTKLSRDRQLEVCMQCHLETTSFSLPHAVLRLDRGVFSYSAAEPLADYAIHFDHAPGSGHDAKFEIVNQVYRLRQSACFQKSEMTCTSCHDPHHAPRGQDAAVQYSAACAKCHAAEKLPAATHRGAKECISCHMPKRRTEDVVHVVMTDHRIVRRAPAGLTAPRAERVETDGVNAYRGEVTLYYPPQLPPADRDLYGALAQVAQRSNLTAGIARLEAAIARYPDRAAAFVPQLGVAYLAAGDRAKARAAFEKAGNSTGALRGLADTEPDPARAAELLRRVLAQSPRDAVALYQLAKITRSAADAQRALDAAPESPDAWNLLGSIHASAGNFPEAEKAFREAIRHQPELAELHVNLANAIGARGDFDETLYHHAKAAALDPKLAGARFGKAAALAALGRFPESELDAAMAVQLDPRNAAAWELLGNLVARKGGWSIAAGHYRKAIEIQPGFARAHLGLGTALAAQGQFAAARAPLEQAAATGDPATRQEAMELLTEVARRQ